MAITANNLFSWLNRCTVKGGGASSMEREAVQYRLIFCQFSWINEFQCFLSYLNNYLTKIYLVTIGI